LNAADIITGAIRAAEEEQRKLKEKRLQKSTHERTSETSQAVMEFVAFGCKPESIAALMGLEIEEFKSLYSYELRNGSQVVDQNVVGRLYQIIKTADPRTANNACQFWLTHHAGWKPPAKEMDITSKDLNYPSRDELLQRLAGEFDIPMPPDVTKTVQ